MNPVAWIVWVALMVLDPSTPLVPRCVDAQVRGAALLLQRRCVRGVHRLHRIVSSRIDGGVHGGIRRIRQTVSMGRCRVVLQRNVARGI